ncbi:alpha/beta hydrolase [Candidatus Cyanaurora vandensis]|uniref:alpha/beta hydrolase n=1 Tax=Candidatus Cyanaurora vandensis TaxID=2714958 RepID=UPI00257C2010|nr:alpha/beta hydrolase [Candidatus Cyanaurora vandensis]
MISPGKVLFATALTTALTLPLQAAENLVISYGSLQRSVPVRAVRTYVEAGKITPELQAYANLLSSQELTDLRAALQGGVQLGTVATDSFLRTELGQALLQQVGQIIRISADLSGEQAVSAALVLAANRPDGITLLNFLETFPTTNVYVDALKLQSTTDQIQQLVNEARKVGAEDQAKLPPFTVPKGLKDPTQPGPYRSQRLTLKNKTRPLTTDIYLTTAPGLRPVILISHGLGEDNNTYRYLAEAWASYGFQVVAPDHPGSDEQRLIALSEGRSKEVVAVQEFVDRPGDLTVILDRLALLNRTDSRFKGRFNLNQVGVFGHSFGGYTALVGAGAVLDLAYLQQQCNTPKEGLQKLNPAFYFQCQATQTVLPSTPQQDKRIKAVIASSPPVSLVFGTGGLGRVQIPSLVVTATDDLVAPTVLEQTRIFNQLPAPSYLLTLVGATHFSVTSATTNPKLPQLGAPDLNAQRSLQSVSVAFWQSYLGGNVRYRGYLVPSYGPYLSRNQNRPTRLVTRPTVQPVVK